MAHKHPVYDTDSHFQIDKVSRKIVDQSSIKTILMQGDHNSERYSFEVPRYIDGHDMILCDLVEIHYLNTDANTRTENRGVYKVDDLEPKPDDEENTAIFTWLVSQNVTKNAGSLSFLIRFACTENGKVVYAWNTGINKDKSVSMSMYNSDSIAEEFPDIFAQILERFGQKLSLPKTSDGQVDNGSVGQFAVSDGKGGITWTTIANGNEVAY